jgi:hypothetical protein
MDKIKSIDSLNTYLVSNLKKINIIEYIKIVYEKLYSHLELENILIQSEHLNNTLNNSDEYKYSIIEEIFNLTIRKSYVLTELDLIRYNLLNENYIDEDINILFKKCNLILERDYRIRKVSIKNSSKNTISYKLTSIGLKKCLINKYENYLTYSILLDDWIYNYYRYQDELIKVLISINDMRLEYMETKIKNSNDLIISSITNIQNKTELVLNTTKNIYNNLNSICDNTNELIDLNYLNEEKANSKNQKLNNNYKCIIYKIDTDKFYILDSNVSIIIKKYRKIMYKFKFLDEVFSIDYKLNNNSSNLNIILQIIKKFCNGNLTDNLTDNLIKISNNILTIQNNNSLSNNEIINEIILFIKTLV